MLQGRLDAANTMNSSSERGSSWPVSCLVLSNTLCDTLATERFEEKRQEMEQLSLFDEDLAIECATNLFIRVELLDLSWCLHGVAKAFVNALPRCAPNDSISIVTDRSTRTA